MHVFHDPRCAGHPAPPGFPERPERLSAVLSALAADSRCTLIAASAEIGEEAVMAAVRAVHESRYVDRFRRAVERGDGLLDTADNPISAGSFAAALGAAAAALAAVDAAFTTSRPVFACARPPGHHAESDRAMGFCFFNQAAVAAAYALARHGAERVAVVDFDVHHGNGTQHLFEDRSDVLYASLHQYPFYPGTGAASERGRAAGEGFTLNLPLAAGGGDPEWLDALRSEVVPALEEHRPDLLVVSAGFDAWRNDPLGGMRVSAAGFAAIGAELQAAADRLCGGRVVSVLEGGYDVGALPGLVLSYLSGSERSAPATAT